MLSVKPVSFPLPRSLSRYAPAVRLRRADGTHRRVIAITGKKRACGKSHGVAVFHRLRPDKHHRNGRSNQRWRNPTGLKDTRRFPGGSSCALLFLPFGLPVSFRCYGRVYLIPRLTLSSGKAVRSKLDCMHEPPFSPTAAPYPVTIVLSPTRKDMQKRHWQQPLVTDLEEIVLNLCAG